MNLQFNLRSLFALALAVAVVAGHFMTVTTASFLLSGIALTVIAASYGSAIGRPVLFAMICGAMWPVGAILAESAGLMSSGIIVDRPIYGDNGPANLFAGSGLVMLMAAGLGGLYGATVGAATGGLLRVTGFSNSSIARNQFESE
ncbi:MAG: hypothetical protein AAF456_21175 [Planctomycetota bacterium]